jgi:hypothetical protein
LSPDYASTKSILDFPVHRLKILVFGLARKSTSKITKIQKFPFSTKCKISKYFLLCAIVKNRYFEIHLKALFKLKRLTTLIVDGDYIDYG